MVLLTLVVVAGVIAVATGVIRGGLDEPTPTIPARALPADDITGRDVAALRFVQGFRGYRMDQVDEALDTLAVEVDRLRAQLAQERSARLHLARAGVPGGGGVLAPASGSSDIGAPSSGPATGPITQPLRRPRRRAENERSVAEANDPAPEGPGAEAST